MRGAPVVQAEFFALCGATDFSSSQIVNLSFYTLLTNPTIYDANLALWSMSI